MRLIRFLSVAACLCIVAPAARAADAAPPAAATDLARLLVTKEMWSQGVQGIAQNVQAQLQGHPGAKLNFPADLPARARAEVEAALPYEQLVGMHAKQLAKTYSTKELDELLAFHRTPTGKHWLQAQPQAFENVSNETQQLMQQKMPAVMQKLSKLAQSGSADAKKQPAKKK